MNIFIGNHIANEIGILLLIDAPKSGLAWGPFLHMRVDIDITKPLIRGKMLQIENVDKRCIYFKYKRLPTFCYRCGILGHQERECQSIKKGCLSTNDEDFQFGLWLQAVGPRSSRGKQSFNHSKIGDGVDEDILILEVEDDERASSPNQSQMIKPSLVGKLISIIAISQLDNSSRISEKQVSSNYRILI